MAGIKVHGSPLSTATCRVLACLYEKELNFEFVPVDMGAGEHKTESFLSLNVSLKNQPFLNYMWKELIVIMKFITRNNNETCLKSFDTLTTIVLMRKKYMLLHTIST